MVCEQADNKADVVPCDRLPLVGWPECQNVKHLVNHEYQYRLRVGRYRVFFDTSGDTITIITIQEVKKRDEHTY